ncbi:MAG: hypothetical protein LBM06_07870 [Prevotellaceae bacterium]|jgi:hypothetical protein|nr:hypothetical protein [Prevotellaceae bacterium]
MKHSLMLLAAAWVMTTQLCAQPYPVNGVYLNRYAKRYEAKEKQWFLDFAFGSNFDISSTRRIADGLYVGQSMGYPMLTVRGRYFFQEAWGLQVELSPNLYDHEGWYTSRLYEKSYGSLIDGATENTGSYVVGLVYRMPVKKWTLMPFVNVGLSTFRTLSDTDTFKAIGSNDVYTFTFDYYGRSGFALNPGITLFENPKKRVAFYLDVSYLWHPAKISGSYYLRNIYNGEAKRNSFRVTPNNYLVVKIGLSTRLGH